MTISSPATMSRAPILFLVRLGYRNLRRRWLGDWSAGQSGDLLGSLLSHPPRPVAEIDDIRRLEGPDERLHPRHDGDETEPAHHVDRLRLGMPPGDRDPTGPAQNEPEQPNEPGTNDKECGEGRIVPEVEFKP